MKIGLKNERDATINFGCSRCVNSLCNGACRPCVGVVLIINMCESVLFLLKCELVLINSSLKVFQIS